MNSIKYIILFVFCAPCSLILNGQSATDSLSRQYFSDFRWFSATKMVNHFSADTFLKDQYFYDVAKQKEIHFPTSGNPGAASLFLLDGDSHGKLISNGFDQFSAYNISPLKVFPPAFQHKRFTNINYHIASKKEQHIFITHRQNIRPWMMAGLSFGALSSSGDFSRQLNTNRNFDIWFAYEAPSKVYRNYLSYTSNKIQNQENGGITADSIFETASALDTRTLPINLNDAFIRHKSRDYLLKQDLNLSKIFRNNSHDSTSTQFQDGSFVLSMTNWWSRKSILFVSQTPDSGYFSNFWMDSTTTYDSSFFNDWNSEAMIEYTSLPLRNDYQLSIGAGVKYQRMEYFVSESDTTFNNIEGVFLIQYGSDKFKMTLSGSKVISGEFENGYAAGIGVNYLFNNSNNRLTLLFSAKQAPQSLRDRLYISNHFIWNNNFELENRYEWKAGLEISKYKIAIIARSITSRNMVFYREDYLPQVYSDYVSFGDVALTKIFSVGKFGMDNKISVAYTGNENVVSVPDFSLFSSLYYKNVFFKKALGFKLGVDLSYYSAYNAYGYMPATGIFYIQDHKKVGNYPTAGIFTSLKIKTADLFLRLDHFNAGIGDRNYYGAYHYPQIGRTFKFGVKWDLSD